MSCGGGRAARTARQSEVALRRRVPALGHREDDGPARENANITTGPVPHRIVHTNTAVNRYVTFPSARHNQTSPGASDRDDDDSAPEEEVMSTTTNKAQALQNTQ